MADNEPDKSEKTEPATPFKLEESRKKGMIAKSMEVNTLLTVVTGLIFLLAAGKEFVDNTLQLCARILSSAGRVNFETRQFIDTSTDWAFEGIAILAPLVSVLIVVAILANFIQVGPIFSVFSIKPDIQRLNPVNGFKRVFSLKLFYELVKSLLKLGAFAAILYFSLMEFFQPMLGLYSRSYGQFVSSFTDYSANLIFRMLAVLILIAIIDWLYTRWEHQRKMRMTRKELKDEIKRREGDPHIRQKRKSLERELRKRSESLASVPEADLVITNPTRFSVVLRYDRRTMIAPQVTGKGAGELARLIREKAYKHRVPVINSPALARALFRTCQINGAVAQEHYVALAGLFRRAYAMRDGQELRV